jgi:putative flippase GtrA
MMKRLMHEANLQFEGLRFVAIGIKSNLLYYVIYAALSVVGIGPKTAVTIVFFVGVVYTFWFNKMFVFRRAGPAYAQMVRYLAVYFGAWLLNLVLLDILLTNFHVNRFIAQGILIVPFAIAIFLALKYLVFNQSRAN